MDNKSVYQSYIANSQLNIKKYQGQIDNLKSFKKENEKGAQEFSRAIQKRRNKVNNSTSSFTKSPLLKKIDSKLSATLDKGSESKVSGYFGQVSDEVDRVIKSLEGKITQENSNIESYKKSISIIEKQEENK